MSRDDYEQENMTSAVALLEAAGFTVRDREQESLAAHSASLLVAERNAARAEVAQLRALCAEAARLMAPAASYARPTAYGEALTDLTARLAAAGEGGDMTPAERAVVAAAEAWRIDTRDCDEPWHQIPYLAEAVDALHAERANRPTPDQAGDPVAALIAALPRCRPWLSGSGGHRVYGECPAPATYDEEDGAHCCDAHYPAANPRGYAPFHYAAALRAVLAARSAPDQSERDRALGAAVREAWGAFAEESPEELSDLAATIEWRSGRRTAQLLRAIAAALEAER